MSNLIIENKVTMSSLEIVEFINNHRSKSIVDVIFPTLRHSDFMAKVPKVLGDEFSEKFRSTYLANNRKENPCYRFQKREACLMAMSYSYELQAIIFDRMTELENNYKKNVVQEIALPQDYLSALKALVESEEAKQIAQQQLQIAAPKVEYFDKVAERSALLNATQVGQKVGMSAIKMNLRLYELNVYNKSIKRSRVFQQWFIDQGLGELKQTEQGYPQAMFTIKGEQWVIEKFISEGLI